MKRIITFLTLTAIVCTTLLAQKDIKTGSMVVGQLERTYLIHIPLSYSKDLFMPLVLVLHGGGGSGENMIKLTQNKFNELSDKEGFVVVYPNGIEKHWNDGRKGEETEYRTHKADVDDSGFISALIDKLLKDFNLDPKRVYITGMSNGAMMTYRLGCELSEKVAAIAPVCGNIPEHFKSLCNPTSNVSLLAINSSNDPLVPWNGGEVTGPFGMRKIGKVLSVNQSVDFWVKHNKCNEPPVITEVPDRDPKDNSLAKCYAYHSDKNNAEVVLYAIEGGGHSWPGGLPYLSDKIIGKTCNDFDASQTIWEFFKAHPKN